MKSAAALLLLAGLLALALGATAQRSTARSRRAQSHASITQGIECGACHTPNGWQMEGGGGGFDHSRTGFPLAGRHAVAACVQCHRANESTRRACTTCHEDPHRRRLTQRCDQCHSATAWEDTSAIDLHRRTRLPLDGMHLLADCTECHRRATDGIYTGATADCFGCHADDYRRNDVHPNHRGDADSAPFPRDCRVCHRTDAWSPAFADVGTLRSPLVAPHTHALRFPLRGPHGTADCSDCHVDVERVPRNVRCNSCHQRERLLTQHRDLRFVIGSAGRACLRCHVGGARR